MKIATPPISPKDNTMSHFTVLVIGDNAESQLAPFDENIEMEEYLEGEVSQEDKKRFLQYYREQHNEHGFFESVYEKWGQDWNGNKWRKEEQVRRQNWKCPSCGEMNHWNSIYCGQKFRKRKGCGSLIPPEQYTVWNKYSTYNPESKWDWYVLGGRWTGYFQLKAGAVGELGESGVFGNQAPINSADSARKGDIDFENMRGRAGKIASERYTEFWDIVDGRAIPHWDEIRAKHGKDIQAARDEYNNLDVIKDLNESERFGGPYFHFNDILDFEESRGDYIQKARNTAIATYAFIHKGKWHQRGEMGWFGMASNEMDEEQWNKLFNQFLDSLPDDTLLSVYDCHI
jgi:hypothetical protein